MFALKGLIILFITSCFIENSYAIRCYTCVYVENYCGTKSCQRNPAEVSDELTEQSMPGQPFNPECNASDGGTNGLSGKFTPKLVLPEAMNTSSVVYYPYCVKEVGTVEGKSAVLRFYDWATVPDLDGRMEEYENVDSTPIYRYYCNKDECNSGSDLRMNTLRLGVLFVATVASKYFI